MLGILYNNSREFRANMTPDRMSQLRNLVYQVQENNWKIESGTKSQKQTARCSNTDMVNKLCGALEEALVELERLES
jgi:hypothetical protein